MNAEMALQSWLEKHLKLPHLSGAIDHYLMEKGLPEVHDLLKESLGEAELR